MAIDIQRSRIGRRTRVRPTAPTAPIQPWPEPQTPEVVPEHATVVATRVLVHGRRRFLCDGVVLLLAGQPTFRVVARTHRNADLLDACARTTPDVVVLHVDLLDLDLITTVADLRDRFGHVRVVAVGGRVHAEQWSLARGTGVEVVPASAGAAALATAVRGDGSHASPANPMRRLTLREHRILELVGHGLKAREISAELGITTKTVENHKQRIFAKLGVQNQAHAVSIAVRAGLLCPVPELRASGDG